MNKHNKLTTEEAFKLCKFKAEAILRREVMEADCLNFSELADKMANQICLICDKMLKK